MSFLPAKSIEIMGMLVFSSDPLKQGDEGGVASYMYLLELGLELSSFRDFGKNGNLKIN